MMALHTLTTHIFCFKDIVCCGWNVDNDVIQTIFLCKQSSIVYDCDNIDFYKSTKSGIGSSVRTLELTNRILYIKLRRFYQKTMDRSAIPYLI